MSQSASSKSTTLSHHSRKTNRCTTPPPTENIIAPPPPSTGSAMANLYRCLQSTTDRIIQRSVDTLYPFISSTTVVPLMPVRGPLTIPVITNTPTGQMEQRIVSSERSTLVTGAKVRDELPVISKCDLVHMSESIAIQRQNKCLIIMRAFACVLSASRCAQITPFDESQATLGTPVATTSYISISSLRKNPDIALGLRLPLLLCVNRRNNTQVFRRLWTQTSC